MDILFFYKDIELNYEPSLNAYFPKSIFKRHLENIKNNLIQKLNKNVKLKSTILLFKLTISEDQFLYFEISYNNTDEWSSMPNPNGSLNTLKKHIESFKGEFTYSDCGSNNGNFVLIFKCIYTNALSVILFRKRIFKIICSEPCFYVCKRNSIMKCCYRCSKRSSSISLCNK